MSIRRTTQTVQNLWRNMDTMQVPRRHDQNTQRARSPPVPTDPEAGNHGHPCDQSQFRAEAMQPPRLRDGSCCAKAVACAVCCGCLLLLAVAFAAVFTSPIGVVVREAISRPSPPPPKKPLPAVLRRFGMLRRGGGRGVDRELAARQALLTAFPHWRLAGGELAIDAVVSDLALGLAAVVEQLDPKQEFRIANGHLSHPLSPLLEPAAQQSQSEQELEL